MKSLDDIADELVSVDFNKPDAVSKIGNLLLDVIYTLQDGSATKTVQYKRLTPHAERVLAFLKQYPGLAFQVGNLSANMDGLDLDQASSAVQSLYHRDLIKRKSGSGRKSNRVGAYSYYYEQLDSAPSDDW